MSTPSCEYCGRCLSVCPSYKHFLVETFGPRARIDLAQAAANGEMDSTGKRYSETINACLQCLACSEICAKGVPAADIILKARQSLRQNPKGFLAKAEKKCTAALIRNRNLVRKCFYLTSILQKIFPAEKKQCIRHIPDIFSVFTGKRSMPLLSKKSLFEIYPEFIPAEPSCPPAGDVALFSGCFGGLVNVQASECLIQGLTLRGYNVHLPKAQACCGAPAEMSGFGDVFEEAEEKNTAAFQQTDMPILTLCATCFKTLSHEYKDKAFSDRVMDAGLFLSRHDENNPPDMELQYRNFLRKIGQTDFPENKTLKIAIHTPCHFRLNPENNKAMSKIIKSNPHLQLVEIPHQGACCGGGGISSLKNPILADKLGKARAEDILQSGADVVLSECPGCVLQLNNHLHRLNESVRAYHLMELI